MKENKIVSREYSVAAAEILEILNHFPKDVLKQIPNQLIEFFNQVSDKEHNFQYSDDLENVNMTKKTKALLAMIYRNYLCSEAEKKEFDKLLFENEEKFQNEQKQKYNPDELFAKPENEENLELIEYKEEKWYQKIFRKFRNFNIFK